jgi:predicted nuclease of predicted toxin-antitoxin system
VDALRLRGWDVIRSSELLSPKAPDQEILACARETGRDLLTQDLDFSALLALSGMDRPSLVTVRMSTSEPEILTARLLEAEPLLASTLPEGCAITIEDSAVRVRKLPIRREIP